MPRMKCPSEDWDRHIDAEDEAQEASQAAAMLETIAYYWRGNQKTEESCKFANELETPGNEGHPDQSELLLYLDKNMFLREEGMIRVIYGVSHVEDNEADGAITVTFKGEWQIEKPLSYIGQPIQASLAKTQEARIEEALEGSPLSHYLNANHYSFPYESTVTVPYWYYACKDARDIQGGAFYTQDEDISEDGTPHLDETIRRLIVEEKRRLKVRHDHFGKVGLELAEVYRETKDILSLSQNGHRAQVEHFEQVSSSLLSQLRTLSRFVDHFNEWSDNVKEGLAEITQTWQDFTSRCGWPHKSDWQLLCELYDIDPNITELPDWVQLFLNDRTEAILEKCNQDLEKEGFKAQLHFLLTSNEHDALETIGAALREKDNKS